MPAAPSEGPGRARQARPCHSRTSAAPESPGAAPPPSKAALRRRLREAEAQVKALRIQLAQLDEEAKRADWSQHSEWDAE